MTQKNIQNGGYEIRHYKGLMESVSEIDRIAKDAGLSSTILATARTSALLATAKSLPASAELLKDSNTPDGLTYFMFDLPTFRNLYAHLLDLTSGIRDDCMSRLYYQIEPRYSELLSDSASEQFGDLVSTNFASSQYDIEEEEAGKCLALQRWTAAVLHLMRALEPALYALQQEVHVRVPKDQWHQMIVQIESAIRQMDIDRNSGKPPVHARTATKEEIKWFSDVATHFRFMKDAWRNYAAHGKESYDEERATRVYNNVRDFMMEIATKLKESH